MAILKLIRAIILSDVVIVSLVVLLVSFLLAFGALLLSWTLYNERYGISLMEFLQLSL
jgi:hypothetical protein|tara:strand:- start:1680 stop:1853 length:174 start_codon:yes stop_codon:yes gene_type:complete